MISPFRLSLVELLILVVVMGLLGSLVIPIRQQAIENAQMTRCRSNLREIGVAAHFYASEDPEGRLPPIALSHEVGNNISNRFYGLLARTEVGGHGARDYLGRVHPLICPSLSPLVYQSSAIYRRPEEIHSGNRILRMGYVYAYYPHTSSHSGRANETIYGNPDQPLCFDFGWSGHLAPLNLPSHPEVLNVLHLGGHVTAFPLNEANRFTSVHLLYDAMRENASSN